ncbi:hypothetical protein EXW28_28275 (plasmid) [Bacillus mycoides]|nr:hypothetical protein DN409_27975 [Bacillus mycoides]QWG53669.1 hypothetical protein EXW37_28270 [Bacillus mycoides]QWH37476.1 hypothetical protein EXW28_28275 [Bacillus mycoides]
MGQVVDINGYSDNREVIIQVINYGDIILEEVLPYLFNILYYYFITYFKFTLLIYCILTIIITHDLIYY